VIAGSLRVDLVESELLRFRSDFNLPVIPIRLLPGTSSRDRLTFGTFEHVSISLFLGHPWLENAAPRAAAMKLNETLLHELRHQWQAANNGPDAFGDKPGAYWLTNHEVDAREFAENHSSKYRLVRVIRRAPTRSGFSRLGQTVRR
jgi:hypothetical protein